MEAGVHAEKRRKLAPAFGMSSVIKMQPEFEKSMRLFQNHLSSLPKSGEIFNFGQWLQCYAFDNVAIVTACTSTLSVPIF